MVFYVIHSFMEVFESFMDISIFRDIMRVCYTSTF